MVSKWAQIAQGTHENSEPQPEASGGKWAQISQGVGKRSGGGYTGSWQEDLTWAETLLSAAQNSPKSAIKYAKNIYDSMPILFKQQTVY